MDQNRGEAVVLLEQVREGAVFQGDEATISEGKIIGGIRTLNYFRDFLNTSFDPLGSKDERNYEGRKQKAVLP